MENGFLKIAHVGADHTHYAHFLEYDASIPYTIIAGVYDYRPEKARRWAETIPGTRVFSSYEEILEDPTIDGVVIAASPYLHEEYIIKAANAGKHVFAEQPLAISVEAAENIREAVNKAGIHFALANPVKRATRVFAKELADSGLLGDILQVRVRFVHDNSVKFVNGEFDDFAYCYNKKLSGGGALNNMGFHGAKLMRWFLGKPVSVCGQFSSYTDIGKENGIEENAVVVYKFASGAIGTVECGWVHPRYQSDGGFEVHGTKGSVVERADGLYYRLSDNDEGWVKANEKQLLNGVPAAMPYWIEHIYHNIPDDEYGVDEAVENTKMVYAAYEADGKEVQFDI